MRDTIVSLVPRELFREKAAAERRLSDQGEVLSESASWTPGRDTGRHRSKPSTSRSSLQLTLTAAGIRLKASGPSHTAHLANTWGRISFSLNLAGWWCWQVFSLGESQYGELSSWPQLSTRQAHRETVPSSAVQDHSRPYAHRFCITATLPSSRRPLPSSRAQAFWSFARARPWGAEEAGNVC